MGKIMERIKAGKGLEPFDNLHPAEIPTGTINDTSLFTTSYRKKLSKMYEEERAKRLQAEHDVNFLKEENECLYSKIQVLAANNDTCSLLRSFREDELFYGMLYTFNFMNEYNRVIRKLNNGYALTDLENDIVNNAARYLAHALYCDSFGGGYCLDNLVKELTEVIKAKSGEK